jgi:hypothetical protein
MHSAVDKAVKVGLLGSSSLAEVGWGPGVFGVLAVLGS